MTRESTKHGPNLDEQMGSEAEVSNEDQGAASRAEEGRIMEDAVDRPLSDLREETQRSILARYLRPSTFPADKESILQEARANHALEGVLRALEALPQQAQFENVGAVWEAVGGDAESRF